MQNIQILQQIFSPSLWVKFWVWKKPCAHFWPIYNCLRGVARRPRKGRCRTFDSYCYTSSSLLLALKMQTQSSPSLESNLNCFWTAPIVLVGTGSPAKKGQVCFLSIPPCWAKGGKCGKCWDVKKVKWASGGEVLISRAARSRERGIGRGGGMWGGEEEGGVAQIGKMPEEAMVGGHRLEILHTLKSRFPKSRARIWRNTKRIPRPKLPML